MKTGEDSGEPRRGDRRRQRQETRAAVLAAATRLFAERGFDGASLPAIAEASGIAVPLMLYHFGSKDGLWREAVTAVYARVEAHLAGFAAELAAASGIAFFRIAARAHVTALAANPEYMCILFQEGTRPSERLDWLVATHQSRLSALQMALIERGQREGLFPAMDLAHAKFLVSGLFSLPFVLAPEFRMVTGRDPLDPAFIDAHVDACLALIMPRPGPASAD